MLGEDALLDDSCDEALLGKPGNNNVANHIGVGFAQLALQVLKQLYLSIRKRNLDFFRHAQFRLEESLGNLTRFSVKVKFESIFTRHQPACRAEARRAIGRGAGNDLSDFKKLPD